MTEPASPGPLDVGHRRPIGRARVSRATRPRRVSRPVRGRAPRPDVSTRTLHRPDPTAQVFLDGSGRRGRRLRRVAYWLIAVALLLLALLWLSQVFLVGSVSR
jgi:hypothetical protein